MAGAPPNPIDELIRLYGAGRFSDLERQASALLAAAPDTPIFRELLAMALAAQSRNAEALPHFIRAAERAPQDAQFWENLGLCQRLLKQFGNAERSLRRSLALRPQSAATWNALGSVQRSLGRIEEARATLERSVAIEPDVAASRFNLAKTLLDQGQFDQAVAQLRQAIALEPRNAALHGSLAFVLAAKGDWAPAAEAHRRTIELDPGNPRFVANFAFFLNSRGYAGEAADAARAVFRHFQDNKIELTEDNVDVLNDAAGALDYAGQSVEAINIYRLTCDVAIDPTLASMIGQAARRVCDWPFASRFEALARQVGRSGPDVTPAPPGNLINLTTATPLEQLMAARKYAAHTTGAVSKIVRRQKTSDKIRIGYFAADYYNHAISQLVAGVIEAHDRGRFEVFAYDFSPPLEDDYRRRMRTAFDRFVRIADLSNSDAAQAIADDGTDIVIDLTGWTTGSRLRLLAARPAPVQLHWLGYPGTTGAAWLDYLIADRIIIPQGDEQYYSEKIIRLPGTYQSNDDKKQIASAASRKGCGLADDAFVFCAFCQTVRITPEIFDVWLRLLAGVERSVLWLLKPNAEAERAMTQLAASRGIDGSRLVFAPRLPLPEHLARLAHADLALDCFPWGSHTTASDMLWGGVPLIGLKGNTFASRVSASLLSAAGLADLIASSFADYHDLALRLAGDRDALAQLKFRVRAARSSILFDTRRFARNIEAAYLLIWQRHLAGQAPDHLDVPDAEGGPFREAFGGRAT